MRRVALVGCLVRPAPGGRHQQFVVSGRVDLELSVVERMTQFLRHCAAGGSDLNGERGVARVRDVPPNSIGLRRVDNGAVVHGVWVVAEQFFVRHEPAIPTRTQGIGFKPELQRMMQAMHREFSIRRAILVGGEIPTRIVGIVVDRSDEFGQFGHGDC